MKMKLHAELIFIWKVSHLDSFWNRGTRELGNGLLVRFAATRVFRFHHIKPYSYYRLDVRFQNMFYTWAYDIDFGFVNWRGGRVVKALDC